MFDVSHHEVRDAVERALAEDIGSGDITSELTVPPALMALGCFIVKQDLVLAGVELLPLIYGPESDTKLELFTHSGSSAKPGDIIASVAGNARLLLGRERVALNFLQRLSGIATLARKHVDAVAGTGVQVLDTRKTTPGLRKLEKMAAAAGGAANHRYGLFDAVLIKNNHITAAGGVREALERTKEFPGPVEIEVRTQAELETALASGAKHLLLDNLSPSQAAEWIRYIDGSATVELSGGIGIENIRVYAETGPDFISCGAITHSAPAVDISFQLELEQHKCD
jgi:nicotinate-nucleotide pyrophosphorylase (carboxylating)